LCLHRDDDLVAGNQHIGEQQPQAGVAVDQDVVIRLTHRLQHAPQHGFAAHCRSKVDVRFAEPQVRGDEVEPESLGMINGFADVSRLEQYCCTHHAGDGVFPGFAPGHIVGEIRLGVKVNTENRFTFAGQSRAKVHDGGGFAHATLLVCYSNNVHFVFPHFPSLFVLFLAKSTILQMIGLGYSCITQGFHSAQPSQRYSSSQTCFSL